MARERKEGERENGVWWPFLVELLRFRVRNDGVCFFFHSSVEEGHEGLIQFLMNEVMKLQQQFKLKTLQHMELSRQNCTLEDEKKKLRFANQELQAFQQSKHAYASMCSSFFNKEVLPI